MKRYLCATQVVADEFRVEFLDRVDASTFTHRTRVSPVFQRKRDVGFPSLEGEKWLLFLFATSPREVVARVSAQLDKRISDRILLSHGLASVILVLDTPEDVDAVSALCQDVVRARETWPLADGKLSREAIEIQEQEDAFEPAPANVPDEELPYEAGAQLRQFNANLAFCWTAAVRFAPAYVPLLRYLHEVASKSATGIAECTVDEPEGLSQGDPAQRGRKYHYLISGLVEVNAALSFLISQSLGRRPSVAVGEFPVGEYSLLGIGSVSLGVWRLYRHMSRVVAGASIPQKVAESYKSTAAFQPSINRTYFDASHWEGHPAAVGNLPAPAEKPHEHRFHVVYFSSRGGFHETLHTISVSWQCLHASALREWNLLTLSHEYLHAHVKDILDGILNLDDGGPEDELTAIARAFRKHATSKELPANARLSMQLALVAALTDITAARKVAEEITGEDQTVRRRARVSVTPNTIRALHGESWWYLNEIMVHVLDYLYFYDGDPETYVSSLWNSWSLVPKVSHYLGHYVERTLCALAAMLEPSVAANDAFDQVREQLRDEFRKILSEGPSPVVAEALDYLESRLGKNRLWVEFDANLYLVRLTRAFFFADEIHRNLVRDEQSRVGDDGRLSYGLEPGDFEAFRIESPVAFLKHRFESLRGVANPSGTDLASLWQLLLLVEDDEE